MLAVLAAGGAAFGGYFLWPSGREPARCLALRARVPAAAKAALAAYDGRIRFDRYRSSGSVDESWYDTLSARSRQVSFDNRGRITDVFADVPAGRYVRTVWVMYDAHEWTVDRVPLPKGFHAQSAAEVAQANRDKVARGRATIVGRDRIAGREAVHLREVVRIPGVDPAKLHLPTGSPVPKALLRTRRFEVDTWVDPLTYLTVRTRSPGETSDETWLPRTGATLAKLKVVVPKGFTRSIPQRGKTLVSYLTARPCGGS